MDDCSVAVRVSHIAFSCGLSSSRGKTDFSRLRRVNFFTCLMWCRGCGSFKVQSENAILKTLFSRKINPWIHIRATRNMTTMSTKEAINFSLQKFGFIEIRDKQRKVHETYLSDRELWIIAPTSSGKSLVFWSLESLFSLFTDPSLLRSSFICDKNCSLISRIFSNKVDVVSGAISTNNISQNAFSVEFHAKEDFQIQACLRLDPVKSPLR